MIYTVGRKSSYDQYLLEGFPKKQGRTERYSGGSVWQTRGEAEVFARDGYAVYGVIADWEKDTAPNAEGRPWRDLLVSSPIVGLYPPEAPAPPELDEGPAA